MVKKKRKSKRTTLKDKYKIKRRVVETHRKSRKQAKRDTKNGVVHRVKKPRDPGIPNNWPFKLELLNEIARAKEIAEKNKVDYLEKKKLKQQQQQKEERQQSMRGTTHEMNPRNSLEEFMNKANLKCVKFDARSVHPSKEPHESVLDHSNARDAPIAYGQSSRKAYWKELRKVIDASDVLLQILDARDPMGTRIDTHAEDAILRHCDKRMVFVLNKIDLVPKDSVAGWLTVLRKSRPTVAIKCGTNQLLKNHVGRAKGEGALQSTSGVGVEGLLHLLKNYARTISTKGGASEKKSQSKSSITVGVIGYPNVGKSSVINTLKRRRSVGISSLPGFTKSMQEVVLDQHVHLIDSPGIVFDDSEGCGSHALLRNCINVNSMEDPISAVQVLLNRCQTESIMMIYSIPAFPSRDVMAFLALVAKKSGHVRKGGILDKEAAARMVIRDWNEGKIPYFTPPPSGVNSLHVNTSDIYCTSKESTGDVSSTLILSGFGEEFDVNKMDEDVMGALEDADEMDFVRIESAK